ncbi:MAG: hypothetical protein GKR90_20930 [Pseudomonadales bacterium]|nr:hypothetical protein [Pseudomonadales bacterium]
MSDALFAQAQSSAVACFDSTYSARILPPEYLDRQSIDLAQFNLAQLNAQPSLTAY